MTDRAHNRLQVSTLDGQFVHPHDACFAPDGDIFVAEWVGAGRITKLEWA